MADAARHRLDAHFNHHVYGPCDFNARETSHLGAGDSSCDELLWSLARHVCTADSDSARRASNIYIGYRI